MTDLPYRYGEAVEFQYWRGPELEPQWIPARAINSQTDRYGERWIKVTTGVDGEEGHKVWAPADMVRRRTIERRPWPPGPPREHQW